MLQLVQLLLNLVSFAPSLSSSGSSAPFSSNSGTFSYGPSKFGPSIIDIEVLNEFSHCHPH